MYYEGYQSQADGSLRLRIMDGSYLRVVLRKPEKAAQPRRRKPARKALRDMTVMDCLQASWRNRSIRELRESEWWPELVAEREWHAARGEKLWAYMSKQWNLITIPRPVVEGCQCIERMFAKHDALVLYRESFDPWWARLCGCDVAQPGERLTGMSALELKRQESRQ